MFVHTARFRATAPRRVVNMATVARMHKAAPGTTETVMASAIHATKKTGAATAMAYATNMIARPTILTAFSR